MLIKPFSIAALAAAITLAACGGGSSGGAGSYGGPPPTTPPQQSNLPVQQTIAGQPGFVNPANNRTLYFLDVDTATGGTCTGGCLSIWPVLAPSSGAQGQNGFTIVTRSDGTGMQWAYKNHPLYMYSGDSGPDQNHGEGIPFAGGHWHVSRPTN
jgi:predicted lipoprotein with Yx(FWY)xxD motif